MIRKLFQLLQKLPEVEKTGLHDVDSTSRKAVRHHGPQAVVLWADGSGSLLLDNKQLKLSGNDLERMIKSVVGDQNVTALEARLERLEEALGGPRGETKVQDRMDTERKFKLEVLAVMRLCRVAIGENG